MDEPEQVLVGRDSLERMKSELEDLKTRGRREISERLQRAREHGDIRENAEYDSAKDDQGRMEGRIRQLEHLVKHAKVREGAEAVEVAGPGAVVTIREEGEDEAEEYFLASSGEDRVEGFRTVTLESPLGKALEGKRPGDNVQVEAPGGSFSVEILEIRPG